jgi:hypothetical protein
MVASHTHIVSLIKSKVQRFFLKQVAELWAVTYTDRLVNLRTLEYRRIFCDLVLCYKILYNKIYTDLSNVFKLTSNSITRGHTLNLYKFQCSLNYTQLYQILFRKSWAALCNKLPPNVVSATTYKHTYTHTLKLVSSYNIVPWTLLHHLHCIKNDKKEIIMCSLCLQKQPSQY